MSSKVRCPHCSTQLTLKEKAKRRGLVECPACGDSFSPSELLLSAWVDEEEVVDWSEPPESDDLLPSSIGGGPAQTEESALEWSVGNLGRWYAIGIGGVLVLALGLVFSLSLLSGPATSERAAARGPSKFVSKQKPGEGRSHRGRGVGEPPAQKREKPGSGEKYALLVGVNNYESPILGALDYAENDIEELASVLAKNGFPEDNIVMLTEERASKDKKPALSPRCANIRKQLRLRLAQPEAGDTVVVALSGHGVQFVRDDEHYFCPVDANLKEKDNLVSISDLYEALEGCKADVKLLFVDACRNSPKLKAKGGDVASLTRPKLPPPPGGIAAFFSCSPGQEAYEAEKLGHGVFFHFVLEGLRGKAVTSNNDVTIGSLTEYVSRKVLDYSISELQNIQRPELLGKLNPTVPLVVLPKKPTVASHKPKPTETKLKPVPPESGAPVKFDEGSLWVGTKTERGKTLKCFLYVSGRADARVGGVLYSPYATNASNRRVAYEGRAQFAGTVTQSGIHFVTTKSKSHYSRMTDAVTYEGRIQGRVFSGIAKGNSQESFRLERVANPDRFDRLPSLTIGSRWRGAFAHSRAESAMELRITSRKGNMIQAELTFPFSRTLGGSTPKPFEADGSTAKVTGFIEEDSITFTTIEAVKGQNGWYQAVPTRYEARVIGKTMTGKASWSYQVGSFQLGLISP